MSDRIYLSGPMTGLPEHNFPAFHDYARRWRAEGYDVISPAETFNGRTDLPRHTYLRRDILDVLRCDGLVLMPGWQRSRGAVLEAAIACQINIPIYDADTGEELLVTIISQAGAVSKEIYEQGNEDRHIWEDASREDDTGAETVYEA